MAIETGISATLHGPDGLGNTLRYVTQCENHCKWKECMTAQRTRNQLYQNVTWLLHQTHKSTLDCKHTVHILQFKYK